MAEVSGRGAGSKTTSIARETRLWNYQSCSPRVSLKCKNSVYLAQSFVDKCVDFTPKDTLWAMMASFPIFLQCANRLSSLRPVIEFRIQTKRRANQMKTISYQMKTRWKPEVTRWKPDENQKFSLLVGALFDVIIVGRELGNLAKDGKSRHSWRKFCLGESWRKLAKVTQAVSINLNCSAGILNMNLPFRFFS